MNPRPWHVSQFTKNQWCLTRFKHTNILGKPHTTECYRLEDGTLLTYNHSSMAQERADALNEGATK